MMRQSDEMTKWLEDLVDRGLQLFGGTKGDMEMTGVKLKLKKDLTSGAFIGVKGDVFNMDPRMAKHLLATKPNVWAKVKDKKKTKAKVETVSDKPAIPGAPPPNKAVSPQDVAQR